jgi:hypothetical protein
MSIYSTVICLLEPHVVKLPCLFLLPNSISNKMAAIPTGNSKEVYLSDDYVPPSLQTKPGFVDSTANSIYSFLAPALSPLNKATARFDAWRERLDLPYPGQVDQLGREAKSKR